MTRARPMTSTLATLSLAGLLACAQRPPSGSELTSETRPIPSTVTGPFVNDPVATTPSPPTFPSGSNPALTFGESPPSNGSTADQDPDPSPPPREDPSPTATDPGTGPADADRQLRGLLGVWRNPESSAEFSGQYSRRNRCVLTIRSRTRAREECTTEVQYAPDGVDRCGQRGRTRRRITGSNYVISIENGEVRFTPGPAELVRDDEVGCGAPPAGRHTFMLTEGWTGEGDEFRVLNTSEGGQVISRSTYTRGP
jgi:hypothetical protein